jgi:hypothetical protein
VNCRFDKVFCATFIKRGGNFRAAKQVKEDIRDSVVYENVDVQEDECTTYFGLDDIKFDPGLHIPIIGTFIGSSSI